MLNGQVPSVLSKKEKCFQKHLTCSFQTATVLTVWNTSVASPAEHFQTNGQIIVLDVAVVHLLKIN